MVVQDGRTYLEAWCRSAESVRLFRLDRIVSADITDEPAAVPSEAATRDLADGLFRPGPSDTVVAVEVTAAGRWFADYVPYESVVELPGDRLRVTLRTPDTRWVARLVLRLGGAGRVVDPPELAAQVRSDATVQLASYGNSVSA